jgi:flagellar P-ring protein precursor FlgI
MVTAELPSFARQGDRIDVTVSSVGDSKSLQGGTLLMTPLKGPDSNTYGVAQGALSIGGFEVAGGGAGTQKNHLTVGRVVNGALVERELPHEFNAKEELIFALKKTDFTTARRISQAINNELKDQNAFVIDGRTIKVEVPKFYINNTSGLIARIEKLDVEPDIVARVIVDERTGTVVMGEHVRISTVAVAHGALFIQIKGEPVAADAPPPAAEPGSVNPARIPVPTEEGEDKLLVMNKGASLGDIVNGLNAIGVTPRDLIAILQSIKASGALHAELDII